MVDSRIVKKYPIFRLLYQKVDANLQRSSTKILDPYHLSFLLILSFIIMGCFNFYVKTLSKSHLMYLLFNQIQYQNFVFSDLKFSAINVEKFIYSLLKNISCRKKPSFSRRLNSKTCLREFSHILLFAKINPRKIFAKFVY